MSPAAEGAEREQQRGQRPSGSIISGNSIEFFARRAVGAFLGLLFPHWCHVCGGDVDGSALPDVCDRCLEKLPLARGDACLRCGMPVGPYTALHEGRYCAWCKDKPAHFRWGVACGTHERGLRALVHAFKYGRKMYLWKTLGMLLAARVRSALPGDAFDAVVPVPIHRLRLKERGFDQARLLAEAVSAATGKPVLKCLARTRHTPSLTRQSRAQRMRTVSGAFELRKRAEVRGRKLLLVDDVMTSCATAAECARVLKRAGGAEQITVAVVARTK